MLKKKDLYLNKKIKRIIQTIPCQYKKIHNQLNGHREKQLNECTNYAIIEQI